MNQLQKKVLVLLKQFHENLCCKTPKCRELSHSSEMHIDTWMHREGG